MESQDQSTEKRSFRKPPSAGTRSQASIKTTLPTIQNNDKKKINLNSRLF